MSGDDGEHPRLLANSAELARCEGRGALWKLAMSRRELDANVIALPPGERIDSHRGPDVDVLIHVVAGSGRLHTDVGSLDLTTGSIVWLPKFSQRGFVAGRDGLRYLTVHRRRQALTLDPPQPRTDA